MFSRSLKGSSLLVHNMWVSQVDFFCDFRAPSPLKACGSLTEFLRPEDPEITDVLLSDEIFQTCFSAKQTTFDSEVQPQQKMCPNSPNRGTFVGITSTWNPKQ